MKLICRPDELPDLIRAVASLEPERAAFPPATWGDGSVTSDDPLKETPLAKEIEDLKAQRDALQGDVNELGVRVFQLQELEKLIHPKVNAQQVIDNAAKQCSELIGRVSQPLSTPLDYVNGDPVPTVDVVLALLKWKDHVDREARILASILGED